MPPDQNDALEDIERLPLPVQVAVMANELKNQSRRVAGVERSLRSVQAALWGLVVALIVASITIAVSFHHP
jgi:hypothetical protein